MGTELEYKLAVPTPALLDTILQDPQVAQLRQEEYCHLLMSTIYYDTPGRQLKNLRWTLRLRQENDRLVATLKTPEENHVRGEWACPALSIRDAIPQLLEQGAPEELTELVQDQPLIPVCAARFTRRTANLTFPDGTVCELCGDTGTLAGGGREEPLCEIEVELKSGDRGTAETFAWELSERFGLREEPMSKFARAAALAAE